MATYTCDFNNKTTNTWTMAVYQTIPSSIGLQSVSWQQSTAPQSGQTGVLWNVDYNVALGNYTQTGGIGVYKATQILPANLGEAWQAVFKDGTQQLLKVGPNSMPDQITIQNNSNDFANLGIGMSGNASVYQYQVNSGASAQFQVTPTYYVGLFNNLKLGTVISTNVTVGPLTLAYPQGQTAATLTATLSGAQIKLALSYGPSPSEAAVAAPVSFLSVSLSEVENRIAAARRETEFALRAASATSLPALPAQS